MDVGYWDHFLPSEKQLKYLEDLATARGVTEGWKKGLPNLTSGQVKKLIEEFKPHVPPGRYAITGADGQSEFYRVEGGTGKWQGMIFVSRMLGSRGDYRYTSISRIEALRILCHIEDEGIEKACRRFGIETGHCGICGSPLTDTLSRKRGIGPTCRKRGG